MCPSRHYLTGDDIVLSLGRNWSRNITLYLVCRVPEIRHANLPPNPSPPPRFVKKSPSDGRGRLDRCSAHRSSDGHWWPLSVRSTDYGVISVLEPYIFLSISLACVPQSRSQRGVEPTSDRRMFLVSSLLGQADECIVHVHTVNYRIVLKSCVDIFHLASSLPNHTHVI